MNKVIELFERYVEYVALTVGVLFVLLMVWFYWVETPVVDISGQKLTAGSIDQWTEENAAAQLSVKVNNPQTPRIPTPTVAQDFVKQITQQPTTQPLPTRWTAATGVTFDIPGTPAVAGGPAPTPGAVVPPTPQQNVAPDKLAILPAPTVVGTTTGLSTVVSGVIVPAHQAMTTPPPPLPAPGAPVPPPVPGTVPNIDKNWVTASFQIPMTELANSFSAARIPMGLRTAFLRTELQREELVSPGVWGNAVIVQPLANSLLSQNPMPQPGNAVAEQTYRTWAEANQTEILQPGFFNVAGGSPWAVAAPKQEGVVAGLIFDPKQYLTGPMPANVTPEQREAIMKERRDKAKADAEAKALERKNRAPGPRMGGGEGFEGGPPPGMGGGPRGPGGGGGGGRGRFAPEPPKISAVDPVIPGFALVSSLAGTSESFVSTVAAMQFAPPRPPNLPPNIPWPPPGYGAPGMGPDGGYNGEMPPQEGPMAAPLPNLGTLPNGLFDPLAWTTGNFVAFAHDENAVPGKTYRYRLRYLIANPLWGQPPAIAKAALSSQYSWNSEWSGWTDNVTVESVVTFYVANRINNSATTIPFEVFRFVNGRMTSKTFNVAPGDVIGAPDGTVDYTTGFTLVDIRGGRGEGYALLMAPDGTLTKRDSNDSANPRYKELKLQMAPPAAVGLR